jgi:hypothetical protein
MLLKRSRLLAGPVGERLPAILARSRDYQSRVSTQLAGQVLEALYELLRGFQAADERSGGQLLGEVLRTRPDAVYAGLLNTLLRLVFLLYAEDRGLMPGSALYGVWQRFLHFRATRPYRGSQHHPKQSTDSLRRLSGAETALGSSRRAHAAGNRLPAVENPSFRP